MIDLIATCITASALELENYTLTERNVQYQFFRQMLTREEYKSLSELFGYGSKYKLSMAKDWHLRYSYGYLNGQKVVCIYHSEIHYFFNIQKFTNDTSRPPRLLIDDEVHKYCPKCDEYYPETKEFFYSKRKSIKLESCCKACYIERKHTYKKRQEREELKLTA